MKSHYTFPDSCVPYSKSACLNASNHQGLQLGGNGKDFIGDYTIKGCHAEGEFAYYGIEDEFVREHRKFLTAPFYRPNGYDCGNVLNIQFMVM